MHGSTMRGRSLLRSDGGMAPIKLERDSRAAGPGGVRDARDARDAKRPGDVSDKPTYRSWKKKYRKLRLVFDQKMADGEELYRLEQKAVATVRRLAIQKEYVPP